MSLNGSLSCASESVDETSTILTAPLKHCCEIVKVDWCKEGSKKAFFDWRAPSISRDGKPQTRYDLVMESEIVLPGPFVVLQGMQGDGMCNTIDSVPIVQEELEEDEFHHVTTDGAMIATALSWKTMNPGGIVQWRTSASSRHFTNDSSVSINNIDPMLASTNMPPLALNPLTATTATSAAASIRRMKKRTDSDSFIVVNDHQQQQQSPRNRAEERAIESWNVDCRAREERQREEWLAQQQQHTITPIPNHGDWWQQDGKLIIMATLPTLDANGRVQTTVKGVLSPGSTVIGTELTYLDWETLQYPFLLKVGT